MKGRKSVISIVAALSLGVAGFAAAHGRPPESHGKPSTTPPPWSHGDNGRGHDDGHGNGHQGGPGNGHDGGSGNGHDGGHGNGHGH